MISTRSLLLKRASSINCISCSNSTSSTFRSFIIPQRINLYKSSNPLLSKRSFATRSIQFASTASSSSNSSSTKPKSKPSIPIGARISSAFSFLFASGLVVGGVGLTGIVVYYFIHDILLPTSDVQIFNKAFSVIEKDPQCQKLLGGNKIKAYGEETSSKWSNRNRPIASRRGFDGHGKEHVIMHFHVKGNVAEGVARLEMIESDEKSSLGIGKYTFRYLVVEVPGHPRIYLIDNSDKPRVKDPSVGFLGVKWGRKKED